jgi:hypothetical protein
VAEALSRNDAAGGRSRTAAEGVAFSSKIALMEHFIRTFEPVAGTQTHVLLDTWYSAKDLWRAARERGFLITTGLKSNRWLRVEDPTAPQGWSWQQLSDYTAKLGASDYVRLKWPKGDDEVYVHVLTTRVRKLYRCQVVIVRQSLEAPLSQARSWASSDLEAEAPLSLVHVRFSLLFLLTQCSTVLSNHLGIRDLGVDPGGLW